MEPSSLELWDNKTPCCQYEVLDCSEKTLRAMRGGQWSRRDGGLPTPRGRAELGQEAAEAMDERDAGSPKPVVTARCDAASGKMTATLDNDKLIVSKACS